MRTGQLRAAVGRCSLAGTVGRMLLQHVTFDRVFPSATVGGLVAATQFGFESNGKRFFSLRVPGRPIVEEGKSVIVLLESPDGLETDRLLGWVDCSDGTLVHENIAQKLFMSGMATALAVGFSARAPMVFGDPVVAKWVAVFVAVLFGAFALVSLFGAARAVLVRRALAETRDAWMHAAAQRKFMPED